MLTSIIASVIGSLLLSIAGTAAIAATLWSLVDFFSGIALYLALFITDTTSRYLATTLNGNLVNKLTSILAIPGSLNIKTIITSIAFGVLLVLILINVMRSMTSQLTGEKIASPLQILARGAMVAILIYILFEHDFTYSAVAPSGKELLITNKGLINAIGRIFSEHIEGLATNLNLSVNLAGLASGTVDTGFFDIKAKMLGLFMSITIFSSVVMAAITFVERIFSFGLYLLLGPIFIAFYVTDETADVAKQWFLGIFAQIFAIIVSLLCWYMFISTFVKMIGFSMDELDEIAKQLEAAGINPTADIDFSTVASTAQADADTSAQLTYSVCQPDIYGNYESYCQEAIDKANAKVKAANALSDFMKEYLAGREVLEDFDQITQLLVCVVFLNLCKNSEKIFNSVGFRTMPNQDSARSMVAGMGTGMMLMMQGVRIGAQMGGRLGSAASSGISKGKANYAALGRQDKAMAINNIQEKMVGNKSAIASLNSQKTGLQAQLGNNKTAMSNAQKGMESAFRDLNNAKQAQNNALNSAVQNALNGRTNTPNGLKHSNGQTMTSSLGTKGNVYATASTVGRNKNGQFVTGGYEMVFGSNGGILQNGDQVLGKNGAEFKATGKGWTDESGNTYSVVRPVSDAAKDISAQEIASITAFNSNDMDALRERLSSTPEMQEYANRVTEAENAYEIASARYAETEAVHANTLAEIEKIQDAIYEKQMENFDYEEQFNRIQATSPEDFRDAGFEDSGIREQWEERNNPYTTSEALGLTPEDYKDKSAAESLRDYFKDRN